MRRPLSILRALGLALLILGVAVTWKLKKAEAALLESMRGFGDTAAALLGMVPRSASRKLILNGFEIGVSTVATPLSVTDALNRFQSVCRTVEQVDMPAMVRRELEETVRSEHDSDAAALLHGVIREDTDREGFLACLDLGPHLDGEALLVHLVDFGRTQNLGSLGRLRYALARRQAGVTTLLLLWTEADANLAELFPMSGDARGRDLMQAPRPKDGQRILSAFEQGMPYGLTIYRVEGQTMATVSDAYETALLESGWKRQFSKNGTLLVEKSGRRMLVRVSERRPSTVFVSLSDLG
jgi:hypothetical protein